MNSEYKHPKIYKYSLLHRLIGSVSFIFFFILLIIAIKSKNNFERLAQQETLALTKKIELDINSQIQSIFNEVNLLSEFITNKKILDESIHLIKTVEKIIKENISNKIFFNPTEIIIDTNSYKNDADINSSFNGNEIENNRVNYSYGEIYQENNHLIIPIDIEKKANYEMKLKTGINLSNLKNYLSSSINNKDIYFILVNNEIDKDIILTSDSIEKTIFDEFHKSISNKKNIEDFSKNTKHPLGFIYIKNTPLLLIIGNKKQITVFDYIYEFLNYKLEIALSLCLLASIIYAFYLLALKPFARLSLIVQKLANSETDVVIENLNFSELEKLEQALKKIKIMVTREVELIERFAEARNNLALTDLRLENEVNERTKNLKNTLEAKNRLLDQINHEIAIPVQGIINLLRNMLNHWNNIDEAKKLESINQIYYTSNKIIDMINYFLELSKFSQSKNPLNLSKEDLGKLTQEVIDECNNLYFNKKSIQINFLPEKNFEVVIDKERIKQVIRDLIINAIRYSPIAGSIAIKIIHKEIAIKDQVFNAVQFIINDQGIGLNEQEIANIFTPFYQGKNFRNCFGSVGLGLALCKEIIASHHGKIWASNNKDGGATFNFTIPVYQPNIKTYKEPAAIDLHHSNPNILIVDDENICLESLELMLIGTNYNIIKANSGHSALKYLRKHYESVSLILLDILMPDMYGINCLQEIKKDPNLSKIPVIIQTGISDEEEILKAFEIGAISFIRKPYNKALILLEIEKALSLFKSKT